jgi:hypothetical protein
MIPRSPIAALLWENWRLTRVEAAWKLAVGIVGGLAVLVVFAALAPNRTIRDFGALVALFVIAIPNIAGWFSIPKINGARPGFPFSLNYTRPVRTAVLVGVPMAYQAAMPTATYLVSALLLRMTSGYAFPLLPVAALVSLLNLTHAPANWAIPNRIVTVLVSLVMGVAWVAFAMYRVDSSDGGDYKSTNLWPTVFDFPLTDYALIAAIGLASFGLTVAGVARQRHGDARAAIPWAGGFSEGLVNLFRFRCPTSSATRAQVWFELKSRGLPVLAIGVVLAIVNPLLFAVSVPFEVARPVVGLFAIVSVLAVLLIFGGNAFGLHWKPGRLYASAFDASQPSGTARLAGLKVLVRSVCMLAAVVAVGASVWASMAFIAVGMGGEPLVGYQPLRSWQGAIESAVGALTGYELVALAVVASIGVAVMVASLASYKALGARYLIGHAAMWTDPLYLSVNIAGYLLLLHGLVLVPLVLTGYRGVGSEELWKFLLGVLVWMTRWIDTPVIVVATVYVAWRVLAERLLTLRSALGAVLVSAAFGAAWLTLLQGAGMQLAGMSVANALWLLSPALLPLMASVLAPWSLNRIRHT